MPGSLSILDRATASFNSTLPTKDKSLEEIDVVNGTKLVSRIARVLDGKLASTKDYHTFQRRSFYLVRTHKGNLAKVRVSIVDGSFFETAPKQYRLYTQGIRGSNPIPPTIGVSQLKQFEEV